jgi:hypothetical protein
MPIEHRLREALDAYMARERHDMDAHLRSLTSDLMRTVGEQQDLWRAELERGVTDARSEAERSFRARIEAVRDELTREMEVRLARERAELQEALRKTNELQEALRKTDEREPRVDMVERLLSSIRHIDEAESLSGILEALVQGAAGETSRVALLMVDVEQLRPWGHRGFADGILPDQLPISASSTLACALVTRRSTFVPPLVQSRASESPAFMRVPVGHTGFVLPITVGGEVVALLYADDVDRKEVHEDAPVWTEELELMARHASARLENLTSVRTVELQAQPT